MPRDAHGQLKQAMIDEGSDDVVNRSSLCSLFEQKRLCSPFHGLPSQGDLTAVRSQALFDPEATEGMGESHCDSIGPFRVLDSTRSNDNEGSQEAEDLIRNVYLEVMSGRARCDIASVRVADGLLTTSFTLMWNSICVQAKVCMSILNHQPSSGYLELDRDNESEQDSQPLVFPTVQKTLVRSFNVAALIF